MTEKQISFCWGCGKSLGNCTCGKESVPISITKPVFTPPICGATNYSDQLILNPNSKTEREPRTCCVCGKSWECTYNEWIYGTCPNCGAQGDQAKLIKFESESLISKKLGKTLFLNNSIKKFKTTF